MKSKLIFALLSLSIVVAMPGLADARGGGGGGGGRGGGGGGFGGGLQIPAHRGQSFRRIADSILVIADSF